MREIIVEVDEDGRAKITTKGYAGAGCLAEVEKLKARVKALGIEVDVERQEKTAEYYQTQTTQQQVRTGL
jgi:hypothetical protein